MLEVCLFLSFCNVWRSGVSGGREGYLSHKENNMVAHLRALSRESLLNEGEDAG